MTKSTSDGRLVSFSKDVENRLVALLIRRGSFYARVKHLVQPEYFRKDVQPIISALNKLHSRGIKFDKLTLAHEAKCSQSTLRHYLQLPIKSASDDYYAATLADFVKAYRLEKFIFESAAMLESRAAGDESVDFGTMQTELRDILSVGSATGFGEDHFETSREWFQNLKKKDTVRRWPTGFPTLDKIFEGGIRTGEMGIIMGPSGVGKTQVLCNFVHNAVLHGAWCVHLTLEMSSDEIRQRYFCRAAMMDKQDLLRNMKKAYQLSEKVRRIRGGKLWVEDCRKNRPSVANVSSMLHAFTEKYGRAPDLIAIDYPDLMSPKTRYGDKRLWVGEIYEDIRLDLLAQFDMAGWVISQSNRMSLGEDLTDLSHVAEDFTKVQTADIVGTLSQKPDEKKKGVMRWYNGKVRDHASGHIIRLQTDFAKSYVMEG